MNRTGIEWARLGLVNITLYDEAWRVIVECRIGLGQVMGCTQCE